MELLFCLINVGQVMVGLHTCAHASTLSWQHPTALSQSRSAVSTRRRIAQVSPKAFAAGSKDQEAGEISLQGTAIEQPAEGTPTMAELKVRYYNQMIRFHKESNNYIEIVRCLLAMYADQKEQEDSTEALALLKQIVWCA